MEISLLPFLISRMKNDGQRVSGEVSGRIGGLVFRKAVNRGIGQ